jgi:hypothetical protein
MKIIARNLDLTKDHFKDQDVDDVSINGMIDRIKEVDNKVGG